MSSAPRVNMRIFAKNSLCPAKRSVRSCAASPISATRRSFSTERWCSASNPTALCSAARFPTGSATAIEAKSCAGPAAVFLSLQFTGKDGAQHSIVTDSTWSAATTAPEGWPQAELKESIAAQVVSFGPVAREPWGSDERGVGISPFDDYTQWKRALGEKPGEDPSSFVAAPGFEIELLRAAGKEEGSWVGITFDPQGRIIIAREDRGLLRLTLTESGAVADIETVNDSLQECRGLLFAHGSLYVNANNSKGLYRLRDTDGDGRFDEEKLLYRSEGGVGHGRNDLALGPGGMIYSIHGDAVKLPRSVEDLTSPAREHRHGAETREGHVIRLDSEGKNLQLLTAGLRNPFGIDFNRDGEMFTYDADAEFDMGSPWYRPTRVSHLLPGGDYGWRGVTGSWPPYFPDHPAGAPPNLDIGKGSPTGVRFGYRSNFSPRYRRALFILDWAYGRIIAVHMTPRGSSYACRGETFVKGRPLNVTNLDFGPGGAMYFVTGGRKTRSGLFRVRYVGPKVDEPPLTRQQRAREQHAAEARATRRRLESMYGKQDESVIDAAWPHLDSPDPRIRYAARTALEHQPLAGRGYPDSRQRPPRERALAEPRAESALTALMALARLEAAKSGRSREEIVKRLNELPLAMLSDSQLERAAYVYELCLNEKDKLPDGVREAVIEQLGPLYPHRSRAVNRRLSRLLIGLDAARFLSPTVELLAGARRQEDQLHYLFVLRNVRSGWTLKERRTYFAALRASGHYLGGQGMPGFLKRIREEALATLSEEECEALEPLLEQERQEQPPAPKRPFVRKWKLEDLVGNLAAVGEARDYERGKALFTATLCSRCHRVGSTGTLIGPDLTGVRRRFSRRDLLESILEPSKTVADNYRTVRIVTTGGKVYSGRVVPSGDYRSPHLRLAIQPELPLATIEISKSEIEQVQPLSTSWMPKGLLDTCSQAEILDLLAFIESAGNPDHPSFR